MRTIEIYPNDLKTLVQEGALYLNDSSRTIYLDPDGYMDMNYQGDGYKPVKITIDFEYDENLKFTEDED